MRKVQLRRMRQRKTVWVLGALVLLALGALWWWAAQRPPSIVIPPRQYPPNNAYDAYKQIAQGVSDLFATDARLRDIESRLFSRGGAPVSQAERRYFLQKMQPFLEAYRRHTEQPCVAVIGINFRTDQKKVHSTRYETHHPSRNANRERAPTNP